MRTQRLFAGLALSLAVPVVAAAEPTTYKVNGPHSAVTFSVRHFVSEVGGRFIAFDGAIKYDRQNPANDGVQFTVKAASLATDNEDRDKHLKSPDFFDVEKYPTLTFTSTSVKKKDDKTLEVTGDFTLHGVTKRITIPVTVLGTVKVDKGEKAGFKTNFHLDRKDYGVVWNRAMEGAGTMLGDEVAIDIRVEADTP